MLSSYAQVSELYYVPVRMFSNRLTTLSESHGNEYKIIMKIFSSIIIITNEVQIFYYILLFFLIKKKIFMFRLDTRFIFSDRFFVPFSWPLLLINRNINYLQICRFFVQNYYVFLKRFKKYSLVMCTKSIH